MTNLPYLVIDKSFAYAVFWRRLCVLNSRYKFIVPSAFYHEVFRNDWRKRRNTLRGFGEFQRVNIPTHLRFERRFGRAAPKVKKGSYGFNPIVLEENWSLGPEHSQVVEKYQNQCVAPEPAFWREVLKGGVLGFSNTEMDTVRHSDDSDFFAVCQLLRDQNRIRLIASKINYPHAEVIDESWFFYRQLQAWCIQGLVLCRRYPKDSSLRPRNFEIQLQHDIHDSQYLTLGLIFNSLATNEIGENNMAWRFTLLAPTGFLVRKDNLILAV
jgi:hypothetical protein